MPTDVLIVNIAVLFAVLEADLGRRKITRFRILRPLLLAAGLIPLFIVHPATAGNGEILEIALAGLGALLGLVALMGYARELEVHHERQRQRWASADESYGYDNFDDDEYDRHANDDNSDWNDGDRLEYDDGAGRQRRTRAAHRCRMPVGAGRDRRRGRVPADLGATDPALRCIPQGRSAGHRVLGRRDQAIRSQAQDRCTGPLAVDEGGRDDL